MLFLWMKKTQHIHLDLAILDIFDLAAWHRLYRENLTLKLLIYAYIKTYLKYFLIKITLNNFQELLGHPA